MSPGPLSKVKLSASDTAGSLATLQSGLMREPQSTGSPRSDPASSPTLKGGREVRGEVAMLGGSASSGALSSLASSPPSNAAASPRKDSRMRGGGSKQARYLAMLAADEGSQLVKRSVYFPIDSPRTTTTRIPAKDMVPALPIGADASPDALAKIVEDGAAAASPRAEKGGKAAAPSSSQADLKLPDIKSPSGKPLGGDGSPMKAGAPSSSEGGGGSSSPAQLPPIRAPPDDNGVYDYKPVIRLEKRSAMGMRPLIAGA